METILFQSATILFPDSPFHNTQADVLVRGGKIEAVGTQIDPPKEDITVINAEGNYLGPGFFDMNVNFGEPGYETKENLESGSAAAAAGGFTGVALQPGTNPPLHSRSEISLIRNSSRDLVVDMYPVGCISAGREGKDMAELFDMHLAGAVAFSDGVRAIADSGLMSRALLYAKGFDGIIMSYPEDKAIAGKGKMNEGITSTYLGIKGIPSLAEEIFISRDLFLAEYNDAKIHFSTISTAGSVELIRAAKKKGLKVTCDVAAHHLVLTDKALTEFNTNFKVKPPLRTSEDVKALIAGLNDGTIDAIVSQHTPHEIEHKEVEFEIASYGITSLQTVLPMLVEAGLNAPMIVEKLSIAPRRILGLPLSKLSEGEAANLVLFGLTEKWTFDGESNRSLSTNSPYLGRELTGKALAVINNSQIYTTK